MKHDRIDARAAVILVLCCAAWGLQQVGIKVAGQEGLGTALQACLRSAGATVLLFGFIAARGSLRELVARDRSFWPGMLIALLFSGEFLFLYAGLQRTTASRGVLLLYTAPFFVAGTVHFLLPAERLGPRQVIGFACAFIGVGCAAADGLMNGTAGSFLGDALVVVGAVFWAATTLVIKVHARLRISAAKILFYQVAGSIPVFLVATTAEGQWGGVLRASETAWFWLGYQTVIVASASYMVWFWLIARYPAGRLSAFTFLSPLFGMIAGVLLLDERATPALILALVFVAAGIRLVNGPPPRAGETAHGRGADPYPPPHRGGVREGRL